jgi:hypothetical protein
LVHEDGRWGQERPLIQIATDSGGIIHSGNFMDEGLHDIACRDFIWVLIYIQLSQKENAAAQSGSFRCCHRNRAKLAGKRVHILLVFSALLVDKILQIYVE